jgi:hypothetical protein
MNDLIRRADAIALASGGCHPANLAEELAKLPSAQPDVPDTNVGDMISRQAAIDAVIKRDANCGIDSAEALRALPSAQRWIPCSERLPRENGDYLVTFKYLIFYPVEVCEFKDGKWDSGMYDVVAWMFVPEAYREDGDNNG